MSSQIGRRSHHHASPRVSERDCDHVDGYAFGAADPEIKTARDDVHHAALGDDIDVDLGVLAHEWQDEGREDLPRCCREGVDAQRA